MTDWLLSTWSAVPIVVVIAGALVAMLLDDRDQRRDMARFRAHVQQVLTRGDGDVGAVDVAEADALLQRSRARRQRAGVWRVLSLLVLAFGSFRLGVSWALT